MAGCRDRMLVRLTAAVAVAVVVGCGPVGNASQVVRDSPVQVGRDGGSRIDRPIAEAPAVSRRTAASPRPPAVRPNRLAGALVSPDVLVLGTRSLPSSLREQISDVRGVRLAAALSVASMRVAGRSITVAAVKTASYRRFTPKATATADGVWQAVTRGEVVLSHVMARTLRRPLGGTLALRQPQMRIGALATTVPRIDAVVGEGHRSQLGFRSDNAILVSVDRSYLGEILGVIRAVVGQRAGVHPLTETAPPADTVRQARLTGGAVARAVGSFRFRYFADGSVAPDPRWVAANIRTETVPVLGTVTCHRVMLPQLRAALEEIIRAGLSSAIDPSDYGGCYVPRFIERNPNRGLSLHTWGIAVDLNVAGNQRGTVGEIDHRVVGILKRWGFAWGGDWRWTDPMHFELAALVRR